MPRKFAIRFLLLVLLSCARGAAAAREGEPFRPLETSPVLAKLKQNLDRGARNALSAFWAEAASRHTPLVEADPQDPKRVIVTFVWRAETRVKAVLLWTQLVRTREMREHLMENLAGTDLWYKAFNLRADVRFTYFFVPDPGATFLANPNARKLDPLNPKELVAQRDPESPEATVLGGSIAELPLASPEPWITKHPETPAGKVGMQRYQSAILKNSRRIWTYLPPGYCSAREPYPLLIAFDGCGYVDPAGMNAPVVLDNLIAAHKVPALVALFVENPWDDRLYELTNDHSFVDFLADELLPWAHKKWSITDDPKRTIVTGVSAGGLTSGYAAFERPDLFGNVLSLSGAYWRGNEGDQQHFEWLTGQLQGSAKLPIRFVLQVGALEQAPSANNGPSLNAANRHLRDVLAAKGYDLDFSERAGAHEFINWRDGFADGLIWIFRK